MAEEGARQDLLGRGIVGCDETAASTHAPMVQLRLVAASKAAVDAAVDAEEQRYRRVDVSAQCVALGRRAKAREEELDGLKRGLRRWPGSRTQVAGLGTVLVRLRAAAPSQLVQSICIHLCTHKVHS